MDLLYPLARAGLNWYNARGRGRGRGRRGRGRGGSRPSGMRRSRAGVASRVPTRTVMQGSFSGSIRQYFTVENAITWYKTVTVKNLLADSFAGLGAQFDECRVNSVRIYYEPNVGTNALGSYAACLYDITGKGAANLGYREVLASPGSVSRKSWQTCGLHWKWTEPSDAEYRRIEDDWNVCVFQIAANGTNLLGGTIIVDASLILRNAAKSTKERVSDFLSLTDLSSCTPNELTELQKQFDDLVLEATSVLTDHPPGD